MSTLLYGIRINTENIVLSSPAANKSSPLPYPAELQNATMGMYCALKLLTLANVFFSAQAVHSPQFVRRAQLPLSQETVEQRLFSQNCFSPQKSLAFIPHASSSDPPFINHMKISTASASTSSKPLKRSTEDGRCRVSSVKKKIIFLFRH